MILCIEPADSQNEEIYIEADSESQLDDIIRGSSYTWVCRKIDVLSLEEASVEIKRRELPDETEPPF